MPTALLFPGQGSQTEEMRATVERFAPELLELALSEVGADPFALVDDGTACAQPAIYCASIAGWTQAGRPEAALHAGHSLGELGALVAAAAIDPADGLRLAVTRGRVMQRAAERRPGGMLALLGDGARTREIAERCGAVVANDNGPTQIVAAGSDAALVATAAEAKASGMRAIRVAVKGAFHSAAMEPAVAPYRAALAEVEVRPPALPVFSSMTARPFAPSADAIRDQLALALVRPVRWRETLERIHRGGVRTFVETGPGKGLTRMVRRAFDDVEVAVLGELEAARG
jgi:malonyl CoA-acyl carrier protein transacylase